MSVYFGFTGRKKQGGLYHIASGEDGAYLAPLSTIDAAAMEQLKVKKPRRQVVVVECEPTVFIITSLNLLVLAIDPAGTVTVLETGSCWQTEGKLSFSLFLLVKFL